MPTPTTRRHFIRVAGGAALAVVAAPQALALPRRTPLIRGGRFDQGVLSGEPTATAITLWTHVGDAGDAGAVRLEVATDKGFRHVVAHEDVRTSSALGHTVKARVGGLKPHERYFYRFETKGSHSPVGRFATAPAPGSKETIRFAMVSCQEYTLGFYNAHALLKDEDVDFVLQLGDYIYADVAFPKGLGVRNDPRQNAVTLQQYRDKYALYRTDPNLRAVHANAAFINLWDDHEVQNNYAGGDPAGGEVTSPYPPGRKQIGYRAFFEQQPTYSSNGKTRLYHHASFGKLMDLFVLDERQYRARQPCGMETVPNCDAAGNPSLKFLGAAQQSFVKGGLAKSKATWKVIANEVQIMRRREADGQSGVDDRDAWGGYLAEREALLRAARGAGDVVFCTGDVHEFIAGTARLSDGTPAAAEIVGSAITSLNGADAGALQKKPGYGTLADPMEPPDVVAGRLRSNPEWSYLDSKHKGYVICDVSPTEFKATMKKVQTIRAKSRAQAPKTVVTVTKGSPAVKVS